MADAELRLAGGDDAACRAQGGVRGRTWQSTARAAAGAGHGARHREGGRADAAVVAGEAAVRGELEELRTQLVDLLDRWWIQHSTAGHAAWVILARKPDGTWHICYY
jgi:hypothetical protein